MHVKAQCAAIDLRCSYANKLLQLRVQIKIPYLFVKLAHQRIGLWCYIIDIHARCHVVIPPKLFVREILNSRDCESENGF